MLTGNNANTIIPPNAKDNNKKNDTAKDCEKIPDIVRINIASGNILEFISVSIC